MSNLDDQAAELVHVERPRTVFGVPLLRYSCAQHGLIWQAPNPGGAAAERLAELGAAEVRAHLSEHHLDDLARLGAGPCQRCAQLTDHLRAVDHLGGASYVCQRHAPSAGVARLIGVGRPE